jgi:hypothetical protein
LAAGYRLSLVLCHWSLVASQGIAVLINRLSAARS